LYHRSRLRSNWPQKLDDGTVVVSQAVVFGLGSMFNHAHVQNIGWERDFNNLLITYKTLRDIKAGEEMCKTRLSCMIPPVLR
jgi:SET domain-containing protein